MEEHDGFADRLKRIEAKHEAEPRAPAPAPRRRSTFKSSNPPSSFLYRLFTPSRIIGLVGFAVFASYILATAGGIGQHTASSEQLPGTAATHAAADVPCVEIHHPLDLMRHNSNPETASIPVCEIGADNH